ncbi:MAG: hypothetical protein ABID79_02290 [Elusimicrobiota bacterium]
MDVNPLDAISKIKHKYGWLSDIPDNRDFLYARIIKIPKVLPDKIDLRKGCSSVKNQGQLGSCTANALAGNLEFLDIQDGNGYTDQSRLFVYYSERLLCDTVNDDSWVSRSLIGGLYGRARN